MATSGSRWSIRCSVGSGCPVSICTSRRAIGSRSGWDRRAFITLHGRVLLAPRGGRMDVECGGVGIVRVGLQHGLQQGAGLAEPAGPQHHLGAEHAGRPDPGGCLGRLGIGLADVRQQARCSIQIACLHLRQAPGSTSPAGRHPCHRRAAAAVRRPWRAGPGTAGTGHRRSGPADRPATWPGPPRSCGRHRL